MVETRSVAGRIVGLTISSPVSTDEQREALVKFGGLAAAVGEKFIAVADCREARIFPPEVEEGFARLMRNDNPHIERAAILVSASAVFSLQLERLVREAGNPRRRTFRSLIDLESWLGEILTTDEKLGLARFFA